MHIEQKPYSYRQDPSVPDFPDEGPLVVMDAKCGLCSKGAKWIADNDKREEFTIVPIQSGLGKSILSHYGMDIEDPASWIYLNEGKAFTSLDAVIRVALRLGGVSKMLIILKIFPRGVQDYLYAVVARNRIRVMGRADLCNLPDPEIQKRLHF